MRHTPAVGDSLRRLDGRRPLGAARSSAPPAAGYRLGGGGRRAATTPRSRKESQRVTGKLRVGVIGCGHMTPHHVDGYLTTGRYDVVALADLDEAAMRAFDAQFGLQATHYRDARVMLDGERLDVVSIGTWHTGHAPWTVAAAARRPKAILCEKPMAETLGRAEEMLMACHRNQVKLVIGHQRRFLPAYTLARDLIARGAIGGVSWLVSFGGQGLPNYSTHHADMFRYLLGDEECR